MVRVFGTMSMLVTLAIGAFLWSQQGTQVQKDAPTAILQAASTAIELNHRIRGSYAGVTFGDVRVTRADASSYCLEAAGYFVVGPGGTVKPGRC